jgi:hypothetical protein
MSKTLRAVFDGETLRPEGPVDLKPNTRYVVTIEGEEGGAKKAPEQGHPLTQILAMATDMGVDDLSTRHSWYAHGKIEDEKE